MTESIQQCKRVTGSPVKWTRLFITAGEVLIVQSASYSMQSSFYFMIGATESPKMHCLSN